MNAIIRNIPNSITCLNLLSGTLAIIFAARGDAEMGGLACRWWACIFIGIAAVADFLDGFAARLLHAYSELGKQLDSLADLVSFGVAPAMIVFYGLEPFADASWVRWGAMLIPVAGALRLARFNIDIRQTTDFIGLPIPANAIFWIGYAAMLAQPTEFLANWYWFGAILLFECWLMVSPLRLFSLKFKSYGWKGNEYRWLIIITAIAMVAIMGVPGLMWLIVAYVCYGAFAAFTSK